jgi:Fe-S cluster biogenesis protein NfuA/nitrite reductase/ring-hydroxylating ferredoxin subunit
LNLFNNADMNATLAEIPVAPRLELSGAAATNHPPPPLPTARGDVNSQGKRIQDLIGKIGALPDVQARELLQECLQSVLMLHEEGLARMMLLIRNAGAAGREVSEALLKDKLVRGLLLIHSLHPVSLEKRLKEALDKVRPYMESHGGNVELIALENDHARLRLEGTCKSCPSSSVTMELAVRQAVEEACPDLLGFEVEGVVAQSATTDHAPAEGPKWNVLEDLGEVDEGELRSIEVDDAHVLLMKTGGNLYAYRNICPACGTRLDEGTLKLNILKCVRGHEFDARRAGICEGRPEVHLEPFPLLSANGTVRISVR